MPAHGVWWSSMPARDLDRLLADLDPVLDPKRWRFVAADVEPAVALMTFHEDEGPTAIVEAGPADRDVFRRITLRVHSSLHAVGLTVRVSSALAADGIAANVVAAFYHDHVFVPEADASSALAALRRLSAKSRGAFDPRRAASPPRSSADRDPPLGP